MEMAYCARIKVTDQTETEELRIQKFIHSNDPTKSIVILFYNYFCLDHMLIIFSILDFIGTLQTSDKNVHYTRRIGLSTILEKPYII